MKLDPANYTCPDHPIDVTDKVEAALDEDEDYPQLTYGGRRAGPRPFQVIVICEGADGSGKHEVTCTGTWSR
jgi:hypothetical protein